MKRGQSLMHSLSRKDDPRVGPQGLLGGRTSSWSKYEDSPLEVEASRRHALAALGRDELLGDWVLVTWKPPDL